MYACKIPCSPDHVAKRYSVRLLFSLNHMDKDNGRMLHYSQKSPDLKQKKIAHPELIT